jgi:hypothetical protein
VVPMVSYNGALDMTGLPNVDSNGTRGVAAFQWPHPRTFNV